MGDPIAATRYAECVLAPDGTVTAVLMASTSPVFSGRIIGYGAVFMNWGSL